MTSAPGASRRDASSRRDALISECDFVLGSLGDLEVERAAGDISDDDYQTLKADYTVRAADLIRQLDGSAEAPAAVASSPATKPGPASKSGVQRTVIVVLGVLAFALGAGWLLAQAAGERGASDGLTGALPESMRDRNLACQQYMQQGDLTASLTCFDDILNEDPQNVEALTYRGWFLVLASSQAQQSGDSESFAALIVAGERSLSDAVAVDPNFADARAFRTVVFERLGREAEACAELATLQTISRAPMIDQLIEPIGERLACE